MTSSPTQHVPSMMHRSMSVTPGRHRRRMGVRIFESFDLFSPTMRRRNQKLLSQLEAAAASTSGTSTSAAQQQQQQHKQPNPSPRPLWQTRKTRSVIEISRRSEQLVVGGQRQRMMIIDRFEPSTSKETFEFTADDLDESVLPQPVYGYLDSAFTTQKRRSPLRRKSTSATPLVQLASNNPTSAASPKRRSPSVIVGNRYTPSTSPHAPKKSATLVDVYHSPQRHIGTGHRDMQLLDVRDRDTYREALAYSSECQHQHIMHSSTSSPQLQRLFPSAGALPADTTQPHTSTQQQHTRSTSPAPSLLNTWYKRLTATSKRKLLLLSKGAFGSPPPSPAPGAATATAAGSTPPVMHKQLVIAGAPLHLHKTSEVASQSNAAAKGWGALLAQADELWENKLNAEAGGSNAEQPQKPKSATPPPTRSKVTILTVATDAVDCDVDAMDVSPKPRGDVTERWAQHRHNTHKPTSTHSTPSIKTLNKAKLHKSRTLEETSGSGLCNGVSDAGLAIPAPKFHVWHELPDVVEYDPNSHRKLSGRKHHHHHRGKKQLHSQHSDPSTSDQPPETHHKRVRHRFVTVSSANALNTGWKFYQNAGHAFVNKKILASLEAHEPTVKEIFYKAAFLNCFRNESSHGCTFNDHALILKQFWEDLFIRLQDGETCESNIKEIGRKHARLKDCGMSSEVWEHFGEASIEIIAGLEGMGTNKDACRGWRMVIARVTDLLRFGFEQECRAIQQEKNEAINKTYQKEKQRSSQRGQPQPQQCQQCALTCALVHTRSASVPSRILMSSCLLWLSSLVLSAAGIVCGATAQELTKRNETKSGVLRGTCDCVGLIETEKSAQYNAIMRTK